MNDYYQERIDCLAQAIKTGIHSFEDLTLLVEMLGLKQQSASEFDSIIDELLANNPDKVTEYKAGKEKLLGFFVGQIMKNNKSANPAEINALIKEKLK